MDSFPIFLALEKDGQQVGGPGDLSRLRTPLPFPLRFFEPSCSRPLQSEQQPLRIHMMPHHLPLVAFASRSDWRHSSIIVVRGHRCPSPWFCCSRCCVCHPCSVLSNFGLLPLWNLILFKQIQCILQLSSIFQWLEIQRFNECQVPSPRR